jgi:hypothetical protein
MELLIMGKVLNGDAVRNKLNAAPSAYRAEILDGLLKINRDFIGDKKAIGLIRRKMYAKDTWSSGSLWKSKVVNLMKGRVMDPLTGQTVTRKGMLNLKTAGAGTGLLRQGISMNLQMGVMYRTKKKIDTALEFLEEGGTITSEKYMPIPVKGGNLGKSYQKFQYWMKSGQLQVVYRNGIALYFFKNKKGALGQESGKLMFVGRKKIDVKFKLGMRRAFEANKAKMNNRLEQSVNDATKRVNNA